MQRTSRYLGYGLLAIIALTGIVTTSAVAQSTRYKLQDLDVPTIRTQLAAYTRNEKNAPLVNPAKAVADVVNTDSVEIQFNKDVPRLNMSFRAITEPLGQVKPVRDMVLDFLGQTLLEGPEYQKLLPNIGVSLRRRTAMADYDVFQPPAGLVTPLDQLLAIRGGCGCCGSSNCYPFTPTNCFELAKDCYRMCMFSDALALLNHAVRHDRQASYYYLKAMTEMQLGHCKDAAASVKEMLAAQAEGLNDGLAPIMEGFNGPLRARIDDYAKFVSANQ